MGGLVDPFLASGVMCLVESIQKFSVVGDFRANRAFGESAVIHALCQVYLYG